MVVCGMAWLAIGWSARCGETEAGGTDERCESDETLSDARTRVTREDTVHNVDRVNLRKE